jgi:tetratricopeptide (TPR) repeat protein
MNPLTLTFDIPQKILTGLADGSLVRNGGVVQNSSGQVVMWLREMAGAGSMPATSSAMLSGINPATGVLNLAMQGTNAGISMRGFVAVTQQLNQMQGMLSVATSASILSLGVSVIGFAVISKKLDVMEKRLKKVEGQLEEIDKKINWNFYANFKAALDLATNAFTMSKGDNRRDSALNAINRFLEAEHIYADLIKNELENDGRFLEEYLLTQYLAYIAEARCYLELEEFNTAIRRFQEGQERIKAQIRDYINVLLTYNPLMYLHPELEGKIDLSRLTKVCQWIDPTHTENSVFEKIRYALVPEKDVMWSTQIDDWINSLPASIVEYNNVKRGFFGIKEEGRKEVIQKLPNVLTQMESMIETNQRFSAYEVEIKAIGSLGISFSEWLELKPSEVNNDEKNLMYILPKEALSLS